MRRECDESSRKALRVGRTRGLAGPSRRSKIRWTAILLPGFAGHWTRFGYLEAALQAADHTETTALRYGWFYGPATSLGRGSALLDAIRRRQLPIVGDGGGIWSFTHIADAAAATLAALQRGATGIYNVADDEPAPVREWLPFLASAIGAPPPRRVPTWLARMVIGHHGIVVMTESRGCSNEKAKTALDWRPRYPSWRTGFIDGLGS